MHILDIARMQKENMMNEPKPQVPDEKAQIVVAMSGLPNLVFRFKSVKQAEKKFKALSKALADYNSGKAQSTDTIHIASDELEAIIALRDVSAATFADVAKFMAFKQHPYQ